MNGESFKDLGGHAGYSCQQVASWLQGRGEPSYEELNDMYGVYGFHLVLAPMESRRS